MKNKMDKNDLTPVEREFLKRLAKLPDEGKKIAMITMAGVAAVYAEQATNQKPA